jgi:hypothetical protein
MLQTITSIVAGLISLIILLCGNLACASLPPEFDRRDELYQLGLLDVTKAPYSADPTGEADSTAAIQRAVNDARDNWLVCFFPEGTYLISDTISCEQEVAKLDRPRHVDGGTQHYWPVHRPIVLMGSTRGRRPVLMLSKDAEGFGNPKKPKVAVFIWAQTWFDAPGKEEPIWGEEQPNISFNHIFKGIDIDVSGHAGAIGIRHSGSQGSSMQDITILADGAYAGMNNCCGQGGGTYNVEVIGGRYGIVVEPNSRFPILTACQFQRQTKAPIRYAKGGSQVPTLLVGCRMSPAGTSAVDMTTEYSYAGVSMVDCVVDLPEKGTVFTTSRDENIFLENTFVRGASSMRSGGVALPSAESWIRVQRYSTHRQRAATLINGKLGAESVAQWRVADESPDFKALAARHYEDTPSFEDQDAVNVKDFGAKGDGATDDTEAFRAAIAASDKVFLPGGQYVLSGTLRLRSNTHVFGFNRSFVSLGSGDHRRGSGQEQASQADTFVVETVKDTQAAPGLSFLTLRGRLHWQSGQGTIMLARAPLQISPTGGGRFYGVMAMGSPFVLEGIRQPTCFYSLNVERVTTNPQSTIRDCQDIRVYYFKVESGTIQRDNAGDANTPCRIVDSRDIRVYCMYGNVKKLVERPMLEVANSRDVQVSQLKAFRPGAFPHVTETFDGDRHVVSSSKTCALFVRDGKRGTEAK